MIKIHHKIFLLSALLLSLALLVWNFIETSSKTVEPEAALKIQHFPVLLKDDKSNTENQAFKNEQFFARINQHKIKSKIKTNIIKISNRPITQGLLSSKYGIRKDPFHRQQRMHNGIDIAAKEGSVVRPLGEGKVLFAGKKAGFGNMVEIQHGKTVVTRYAHLKQFLVDTGQQVTIKDKIGLVGSSGRSTGPHLHLEVLFNGEQVDPQVFLANHFGSRKATMHVAKSKPEVDKPAIEKPSTQPTEKVAAISETITVEKETTEGDYPQISYQDYVNSVDGLFGLSAPESFSQ